MAAKKFVEVVCDFCGWSDFAVHMSDVRQAKKNLGFRIYKGKDICVQCQEHKAEGRLDEDN